MASRQEWYDYFLAIGQTSKGAGIWADQFAGLSMDDQNLAQADVARAPGNTYTHDGGDGGSGGGGGGGNDGGSGGGNDGGSGGGGGGIPPDGPDMGLLDSLRAQYPWLQVIGLDQFVVDTIRSGATIDETLAKVRQTSQYKARFPGLVKADGTRRFATEAEYLREEESYRQVLQEFGAYNPNQDSAYDYLAFMDQGITPEQLSQRFQVYKAIERGSTELRDSFYVYAGMDVSVDDLYQAVVSPEFRQQMVSAYDETVAKQDLDYETFISRATERGLERVAETLRNMQTLGLVTGSAVSQMLSVNPNFAREMMGAIFQSTGDATGTMSVDELMATFDYAMIGSAARESGFDLPTKERLEEFRSAGVDRARALRGYSQAALRQAGLQSMADRFNQGGIGQRTLEGAFVAQDAASMADVTRLFEQERSLSKTGRGFSRQLEGNRVVQQGRRRY